MTTTMGDYDVIDLSALDWDHEPPCESGERFHAQYGKGPATLVVLFTHECGASITGLLCQQCLVQVEGMDDLVWCKFCKEELPHHRDSIAEVTSIKDI